MPVAEEGKASDDVVPWWKECGRGRAPPPPAAKRDVMELARERLAAGEAGVAETGEAVKLEGGGGGDSNVLARSVAGAGVGVAAWAARRPNELVEVEAASVVLDAEG